MGKQTVVYGHDSVTDAIARGYNKKSALAQHKKMLNYVRAMRNGGRSSNPIVPDKADILPWTLWDRVVGTQAAASLTEYDFFTVPINGTIQGGAVAKTKNDTNMEQVSTLPSPQHFNVTSLGIYFSSNTLKADIDLMLNGSYIEFWISNKVYAEGPLVKFPAGAGLSGYTTRTSTEFITNGVANCCAVVDFRMGDNIIGHHILQNESFKVKWIFPTAITFTATASGGVGMNTMCFLDGILSRGVR